jgi:hypothetical protein
MYNDGKDYEQFVATLQQALLNAETFTNQKNIQIELNKKIKDNCGNEREFDLYWEYELGGLVYKTVIECKDYNSRVSVEKIDALIGKVRDIPDLRAVFATKKGYQSGAQKKAEMNKIDLLIIREQNDTDWEDSEGNPFIREICINMQMIIPARITKFDPILDATWLAENTDIDISNPPQMSGLNNEIFIENVAEDERYSLYDLANHLKPIGDEKYGVFSTHKEFDDAFISFEDVRWKLKGYKVEYSIGKPINDVMTIDFSKELVGVIEYLSKGKKKSIFREGIIKENDI